MTSTLPARTQARYRGAVYGIDVVDHASFMADAPVVVVNDYVGKTRQRGRGRENQHRDKQPFSDLILGSPRVLWEGVCTEDELGEMERHFIQDVEQRPRLNEKMNEDNPHMIPKQVQRAQRQIREPGWVPFEQRNRASLLEWDTSTPVVAERRRVVTRSWTAGQRQAVLWSAAWILTGVATLGGFHHYDVAATWVTRLVTAAVVATVLLGWAALGAPTNRKQWKRTLRRRRRR